MRRTTLLIISLVMSVLLFTACSQSGTTGTTGLTTSATTSASATTAASTTATTQSSPAAEAPVLTLSDWLVGYTPADEFGGVESYSYALTVDSDIALPDGYRWGLDLELLDTSGEILLAGSAVFVDTDFSGLTTFMVVVDFHGYAYSQDELAPLADTASVQASFWPLTASDPYPEGTPAAYIELDAQALTVQEDMFGIVGDLLTIPNDNYPEIGACILTIDGVATPYIIPMSADYDDPSQYSGYLAEPLANTLFETVAICPLSNASAN